MAQAIGAHDEKGVPSRLLARSAPPHGNRRVVKAVRWLDAIAGAAFLIELAITVARAFDEGFLRPDEAAPCGAMFDESPKTLVEDGA
jgi:hypothetical protein